MMQGNYDVIAKQWTKIRAQLPAKDLALFELFRCYIPPHGRLLDLGCGHGVPIAQMFSQQGFKVTGVDNSQRLLNEAAALMPDQDWIHSDLESYYPQKQYHGIIIWDAIFYLPRSEHLALLKKAFSALEPEGVLILSSGGSEYELPPFSDYIFDHEFYYDTLPTPQLLQHCLRTGFKILRRELVSEPDGGRNTGRLGLVLQKPSMQ